MEIEKNGVRIMTNSIYRLGVNLRIIGGFIFGVAIILALILPSLLPIEWWLKLLFILGGIGVIIENVYHLYKLPNYKEIEVEPGRLTLRRRNGEEIIPQIHQIDILIRHRGKVWGRYAPPVKCIVISGEVHGETLPPITIGGGGPKCFRLSTKKLVALRDDLKRFFGDRVEERKVRF